MPQRSEEGHLNIKSAFLAILDGVDTSFPKYMWDKPLNKAELILNLLRQATLNPRIPTWGYFKGPFDFATIPLGTMGYPVIINNKSTKHANHGNNVDGKATMLDQLPSIIAVSP